MLSLRPVVSTQFQILFHSPRRGSFHLSLTVLLRYRSSGVFSVGRRTSQFPTGLACPVVLRILPTMIVLRLRDSHPFSLTFPSHSASHSLLLAVLQPRQASLSVCAAPRSLATTSGIFSFPRGTEMFQFPRCPSLARCVSITPRGFPHSDTSGCLRLHTPDRSISLCTTSFVGTRRLGIPCVPLLAVLFWFFLAPLV